MGWVEYVRCSESWRGVIALAFSPEIIVRFLFCLYFSVISIRLYQLFVNGVSLTVLLVLGLEGE